MGMAVRTISTMNGARHLVNTEMVGILGKIMEFLMTIHSTVKAQPYAHSVDAEVITFVFNAIFIFE